jgi:hypothetical protein
MSIAEAIGWLAYAVITGLALGWLLANADRARP